MVYSNGYHTGPSTYDTGYHTEREIYHNERDAYHAERDEYGNGYHAEPDLYINDLHEQEDYIRRPAKPTQSGHRSSNRSGAGHTTVVSYISVTQSYISNSFLLHSRIM